MLTRRSEFQKDMYELLFKKEHQRMHDLMDEIGKRNSHIQDAQTYSFIHKEYTHISTKLNITTARTPPLAKELYDDLKKQLEELKELDKFYSNVCSLYVYIRNSAIEEELLNLLPIDLHNIYTKHSSPLGNEPHTVSDQKRADILKQFNSWYGKTVEELFSLTFMNMVY